MATWLLWYPAFQDVQPRGYAKEKWMLFASTAVNFGNHIFSPPIRSQMTRCVHPHETGKIFAMLASVESFVPILASATFTRLYNYTADHQYPWVGSFYFAGAACILIGLTIATSIYFTLGGKQVSSYSDEESIDDKSKELTKFWRLIPNIDDTLIFMILCMKIIHTHILINHGNIYGVLKYVYYFLAIFSAENLSNFSTALFIFIYYIVKITTNYLELMVSQKVAGCPCH